MGDRRSSAGEASNIAISPALSALAAYRAGGMADLFLANGPPQNADQRASNSVPFTTSKGA